MSSSDLVVGLRKHPVVGLCLDQKALWPLSKPCRRSTAPRPGLSCFGIPILGGKRSLCSLCCAQWTASPAFGRDVIHRKAIPCHQSSDLINDTSDFCSTRFFELGFQCPLLRNKFLVSRHNDAPKHWIDNRLIRTLTLLCKVTNCFPVTRSEPNRPIRLHCLWPRLLAFQDDFLHPLLGISATQFFDHCPGRTDIGMQRVVQIWLRLSELQIEKV